MRGCSSWGGVRDDQLAWIGWDLEGVVFESEVPYERVPEWLGSAALVADVVLAPADPEVIAARCEFSDEARQRLVVRVAGGFGLEAAANGWALARRQPRPPHDPPVPRPGCH